MTNFENEFNDKYNKLAMIHEKVSSLVQVSKITGDPLREYRAKVNQYIDMLKSLDMMIEIADKDESVEKLFIQKIAVVDTWIAFELNFVKEYIE